MSKIQDFVGMVNASRLLAPNLRSMTLRIYTGHKYPGNSVARMVMRDHLLALRWMNPNAVIYLRETKGQGKAEIEYQLWKGDTATKKFEITPSQTADEVVATVLMAARDLDLDEPAAAVGAGAASSSSATSAKQQHATAAAAPGQKSSAKAPAAAGARAFSTAAFESSQLDGFRLEDYVTDRELR